MIATYGTLEIHEISWLEDDGTLVRVGPLTDPDGLLDVLEQLEPIGDGEFATLVRELEGEPIQRGAGGDELGGLSLRGPGLGVEASIGADSAGDALLSAEARGGSSSTGWEVTIPDPPGPHAERWRLDDVDDGELIVAMLPSSGDVSVDPSMGGVSVRIWPASGDAELGPRTSATAGLRGGTLLFAAVLGPEWADETVQIEGPDGSVLEVAPAGEG